MALNKLAMAEAALSSVSSKLEAARDHRLERASEGAHSCVGRAKANAVFGSSHQASGQQQRFLAPRFV